MMYDLFFLKDEDRIERDTIILKNKNELKHISNVLRKKKGDCITLSNYRILYTCEITEMSHTEILLKINEKVNITYNKPKIILHNALLKGTNFDLQIEKSVEIGIDEFQPISTSNCIADKNKIKKWQDLILKASKQSKQAKEIKICDVQKLMKMKKRTRSLWIVPELVENYQYIGNLNIDFNRYDTIEVFIGPEGGFTKDELSFFQSMDSEFVSLGPNRLRAETAAWISIAMIKDKLYKRGHDG